MAAALRKKAAAAKRDPRVDDDAVWNERLARWTVDEAVRQRSETHDQRIERTNREAHERFNDAENLAEARRAKSRSANLAKAKRVELRRQAIVALWPQACTEHPRNRGKRHDWIVAQLKAKGFPISVEYLVNVDLPRVRPQLR